MRARVIPVVAALSVLCAAPAAAQKVFLNPSDQTDNSVAGGGNEAQYAEINANLASDLLKAAGFEVKITPGLGPAVNNANSWGADIFVSIHTNAGGGHGTETLYVSDGGKVLAGKVNAGLLSRLPYDDRGIKHRTDLLVLNDTNMYAALAEALFHDCSTASGVKGHPPAEAAFLRTKEGQQKIAEGLAAGICEYYSKTCAEPKPQTGWLKGSVFRSPNLEDRIAGAKVTAGDKSAVSSDEGLFELELPPGTYDVQANAEGYRPTSVEAVVVAGEDVWASLGLEPARDGGADGGAPRDGGVYTGDRAPIADGCDCATACSPTAPSLLALLAAALLLARARRRS